MRQLFAARRNERSLFPSVVIGLGIWIGFPTVAAYQDMQSLVSGAESTQARWASFVEPAVAGSTHAAEMPFADAEMTGSISGSGVKAPGIGAVALRGKGIAAEETPDEDRVVRSGKQGRLAKVMPVAPPKAFNAGSVFKRTSMLRLPDIDRELKMAFARPEIKGKEITIAAAFHEHEDPRPDPLMPPVLAALVTNDKPDVLATAYAPAEPDYARISPFESLLQEDEEAASGRFVPKMQKGDHAWVSTVLPASVFSESEQRCLAAAIYFEARGESVKGQAAVAQVVLNRVRNPAYPKSICGVVYQNMKWRNRCQFSFACDRIKDRITSPQHYEMAEKVALAVTAGRIWLPEIGSSTHYYADYVRPRWARTMDLMNKIGRHLFYRTRGGGWS